ncbi:MAG: endonuclease/exonuclease/phosphatase [candidate division Zixibacteria bacterium]|nr:endonuclease/exonuclease/phosphatase [candidate division Zixibacteria bacterium]
MKIRVATANVENLFARYNFRKDFDPQSQTGFGVNDLAFDLYDQDARKITGKTLREVDADILCLQEVENLEVLERFNSRYLGRMKYKHRIVIDSHDPRHIDVAVLSRFPLNNIRTHRHERNANNTYWLFSRDNLEVDVDIEGAVITLMVNHFKSMIYTREETKSRREPQVERVAEIVDERFKENKYEDHYIVLGDFNDYVQGDTALKDLINHPKLHSITEGEDEKDCFTHFYAKKNEYRQLDFILLSPSLKALIDETDGKYKIERRGLPWRAEEVTVDRFDDIGWDSPKASDHCPIAVDLDI